MGPSTVSALAHRLGLTTTAVRRQVDELVEGGLVAVSEKPPFGPTRPQMGRGRPAKYYYLTQAGRERFDQDYDDLAVAALRFLAESGVDDQVMEFARRRAAELERRYSSLLLAGMTPAEKVAKLAAALAHDGYAAVAVPATNGVQLCQQNCPVAHVAEEFPQFCEAETEAFGRLLGARVLRLATLANGDGVCTTHVPTMHPIGAQQ
jgi:predicted ArsR family transcriptional regulator